MKKTTERCGFLGFYLYFCRCNTKETDMTQEEFINTNWHRGNMVRLENGKEYLVKGVKGHGRYLLLYSWEYDQSFVADHNIVDCRTCDYEEPDEVYLERKRRRQAEAEAIREAERQERLRLRAERRQRNIQEQERIHQEAVARKAAKAAQKALLAEQAKAAKAAKAAAAKGKPETKARPVVAESVAKPVGKETVDVQKAEAVSEQPKPKRKRIRINRVERVEIK